MHNELTIMSKAELLSRIAQGQTAFAALLASLTDEQLAAPNVIGVWSVTDVLTHLIAHEQHALAELQHALRGERIADDPRSNEQVNRDAVEAASRQSPAQARASWNASCRQVVAALAALPDADFDPDSPVVDALGDTIDGAFANNTYEHYAEHLPDIEAWAKTLPR